MSICYENLSVDVLMEIKQHYEKELNYVLFVYNVFKHKNMQIMPDTIRNREIIEIVNKLAAIETHMKNAKKN